MDRRPGEGERRKDDMFGEKFGLPEDLPADADARAGHPGARDGAASGHRRVEVEPFDRAGSHAGLREFLRRLKISPGRRGNGGAVQSARGLAR